MRTLKVVLAALCLLSAARARQQQPPPTPAQQQPAFKPYAGRDLSERPRYGGVPHVTHGKFNTLMESGFRHLEERRYEEALEQFRRAVNTETEGSQRYNLRDAYFLLGYTYESLGRAEEAIAAYDQVAEVGPESVRDKDQDFINRVSALYNAGNLHADAGRHREALAAFKRVEAVLPDAPALHYNTGLSHAALGETRQAVEAFARAVKLSAPLSGPDTKRQDARMRYNLGVAQAAAGRYAEAARAFEEAVRLAPDYAEAQYNLALAYHLLGDRAATRRQLDALAKLKPELARELSAAIK